MNVLFCIVSYRTDEALTQYLHSIRAAADASGPGMTLHALVIDNSERRESERPAFVTGVEAALPSCTEVVFPRANLGYFGALSIAQQTAARRRPEVVIFSNADLQLAGDFLEQLYGRLPTDAAVVAPAIIVAGEHAFDQNPKLVERYPRKRLRVQQIAYSNRLAFFGYNLLGFLKERLRSREAVPAADPVTRQIYAGHGALFIFTKLDFFLGLPAYRPFLYGEELFIAEEARRKSELTRYVPHLRVFDMRHASTAGLGSERRRRLMKESVDYILQCYY